MDNDTTTGTGFKPPRQGRSRETLNKILDAAQELLDGRPFDEVSVDEIINLAEVSRSSFYARFPTKESLLPALHIAHLERVRGAVETALAVDPTEVAPSDLVTAMVATYLGFLREFQASITTFDLSSIAMVDRLQAEVISQATESYLRCVDRVDDDEFRQQVEFACRAVGSVLLRAVAPPVEFNRTLGFSDERLVAETAAMATAYLERVG